MINKYINLVDKFNLTIIEIIDYVLCINKESGLHINCRKHKRNK